MSSIENAKLSLITEVKAHIVLEIQLDATICKLEEEIEDLRKQTQRSTIIIAGSERKNNELVTLLSNVEKLLSTL